MAQDKHEWEVNIVKCRYDYLGLTFKQAELVNVHEIGMSEYSREHLFSDWEEWDFDRTVFRKILDEKQFNLFLQKQKSVKEEHEHGLITSDEVRQADVEYHNELIRYFDEEFLPYFLKDELRFRYRGRFGDKSKIDFLKEEYRRYLNDRNQEMLIAHFRHNRHFKPNELDLSLLRQKLDYIFPNYYYFRASMDEPTKSVAAFLEGGFKHIVDDEMEIVEKKFKESEAHCKALFDKYFKEDLDNSRDTYIIKEAFRSPEEEWIQRNMSLLLLDEKRYGLKN